MNFFVSIKQRQRLLAVLITRWLQKFLTWRNIVRTCGLIGMMYLVLFRSHPDATALVALGTMIGLPTFFWLQPAVVGQDPKPPSQQPDPLPPPKEE